MVMGIDGLLQAGLMFDRFVWFEFGIRQALSFNRFHGLAGLSLGHVLV